MYVPKESLRMGGRFQRRADSVDSRPSACDPDKSHSWWIEQPRIITLTLTVATPLSLLVIFLYCELSVSASSLEHYNTCNDENYRSLRGWTSRQLTARAKQVDYAQEHFFSTKTLKLNVKFRILLFIRDVRCVLISDILASKVISRNTRKRKWNCKCNWN